LRYQAQRAPLPEAYDACSDQIRHPFAPEGPTSNTGTSTAEHPASARSLMTSEIGDQISALHRAHENELAIIESELEEDSSMTTGARTTGQATDEGPIESSPDYSSEVERIKKQARHE